MLNYESFAVFDPYKYRHYHNFEHLYHVRDAVSQFMEIDLKTDLLIAFHDLVYTPGSDNNEFLSVTVFCDYYSHQWPTLHKNEVDYITDGIEATRFHSKEDDDRINLFLDADMCILGSSDEEYDKYSSNVRKEFSFFSGEEYKNGRIRFLRSFNRYITDEFNDVYLSQTKNNIARELYVLGSSQ